METSPDIQQCPMLLGTSTISGPLYARYKHIYNPFMGCVRNVCPFEWTPLLDKCFECIKTLACKAPILKPIDHNNPDPIWVITDGSKAGVGAIYGQGPNQKTCRPARFISKTFSNAQQHYWTHEHETISMLKALMKWEDKPLGYKFTLVIDHKGLKYFKTQKNLSVWGDRKSVV